MYQQLISLHFKIFMNNLHNFHKYANSQNIYMLHLKKVLSSI